jgi:4-hydroxythreonine-4-phosphate dehydrogenase
MTEHKPIIGISLGDFNGIGPEVTLKALSDSKILKMCTPVLYGSVKVLSKYRKLMNLEDWSMHSARGIDQIVHKKTNVINCWDEHLEINPGKVTPEAGRGAYIALKTATEDLKKGMLDAIVTAPINKHNIQNEEFPYPGHTEYFAHEFAAQETVMLLVSGDLRVGVVTGHIPLSAVAGGHHQGKSHQQGQRADQGPAGGFRHQQAADCRAGPQPARGRRRPAGLREKEIIRPGGGRAAAQGQPGVRAVPRRRLFRGPAIQEVRRRAGHVPRPGAHSVQDAGLRRRRKLHGGPFGGAHLPDHGTAYSLAGKNQAKEASMRAAIFLACDIVKHRKEMLSLQHTAEH